MEPHLDERARRLFVASEAKSAGYGGIITVARATGMARSTIGRGLKDLAVPRFWSLEGFAAPVAAANP